MKNYKVRLAVFSALWAVMLGAEAYLVALLVRRRLLPTKYLAAAVVLLLLLWGVTGAFLYYHGTRRHRTRRRAFNIAGVVLAVLGIIGSVYASSALRQVHGVIDDVTDVDKQLVTLAVYVRTDDPAQTLKDAADYTFAIPTEFDVKNTQSALDQMKKEIGHDVRTTLGGSVNGMADMVLRGDVDALIVNQPYMDLLADEDAYLYIYDDLRMLYEITMEDLDEETPSPEDVINIPGDDVDPAEEPGTEPEAVKLDNLGAKNVTTDPFLLYIAGSDTRTASLPTKTRNDVNLLLAIDPKAKTIQVVTTPRDSYLPDPKHNYKRDKLTHCGNGGIENSIAVLERLYGLHIDYYAQINFSGVVTVVDAIGGITVYSNTAYDREGMHIVKGDNHLNGREALLFARERYLLPNGDFDRGRNHIRIFTAVLQKVTSAKTLLRSYSSILSSISTMFRTSLSADEISSLVQMQLNDMASWSVESYSVDADGGWNYTATSPNSKRWVAYPKEESLKEAGDLLRKMLKIN